MFGILQLLAETSPSFAKASAALSIPGLSDKLGDMKLKKPAGHALTIYAEKSSLQFVLSQGQLTPRSFLSSSLTFAYSLRADDEAEGTESASGFSRLDRAIASRFRCFRTLRSRPHRVPQGCAQEHERCCANERDKGYRDAETLRRVRSVESFRLASSVVLIALIHQTSHHSCKTSILRSSPRSKPSSTGSLEKPLTRRLDSPPIMPPL